MRKIYTMYKAFGLMYALGYNFTELFRLYKYRNKLVYDYTYKFFKPLLKALADKPFVSEDDECNKSTQPDIIWICWWQGEDNMPPIVKACYKNTLQKAGDSKVQLITLDNYNKYVSLPQYIIDKVNSGQISLTHFSDILRVNLLADHGGLWLDATIYLTQPIKTSKYGFFTIKQHPQDDIFISNRRWTTFCIGGIKGNILFVILKQMFNEYFAAKSLLPDYLFFDFCICLVYDNVLSVKTTIDALEYSNNYLYYLKSHLNDKFDFDKFNEVCNETSIFKLTWKGDFAIRDNSGHQTYYSFIIDNCLE